MRNILLLLSLLLLAAFLPAQELSNLRETTFTPTQDTIKLDTLSIIPGSEVIKKADGSLVSLMDYTVNYASSEIYLKPQLVNQKLSITYRVFPLLFTEEFSHKSMDRIEPSDPGRYDYFTIKEESKKEDIFSINGLSKNGSISRGINFGNNQDLSVNSSLDLQLSGRITDEISIQAAISDNNLPIQAEGNTQQLQEFDQVYIKVFTDKTSLIAGDFRISRPNSYFMNFNKRVQGGGFSTSFITKQELNEEDNGVVSTSINAAISRGKFSRNIIPGVEGNQGPYKLIGDEGEAFIIVLSGTERVYVNGRLMKRGQDNDYIIDYNTAELTFTPNQIINKDLRIVVEFQYSERNYSRSVVFSENRYQKEKLTIDFNVYSEQDSKNQPLQQDLSDEQIQVLKNAGDNLDSAVVSGIDTSGFADDQVRYKIIDSLGQEILVFSKDPDSAIYSARFSVVGQGNGDYIQIQSDANGRVFQWVAPIAGVRQGRYSPIIRLITPKQRQMVTLGTAYEFSKRTQLSIEGAITNNDLNTFSSLDNEDDQSYGYQLKFNHSQPISGSDSGKATNWNTKVFYEQRGRNFEYIERYRNVEFDRDWNIRDLTLEGNEYLIDVETGIAKKQNFLNYEFGSFTKGSDYRGIKNGYKGNFAQNGFSVQSRGSYLTAESANNSEFLRHYSTISQKLLGIKVGAYLEQEQVKFFQAQSDSLQGSSFNRIIWNSFIERGDSTTDNHYKATYGEMYTYLPLVADLDYSNKSQNFDFEFDRTKNRNSRLSGKVTYRKLQIINDSLSPNEPENTLLGRVQYDLRAFKGFLSSNTFYQLGSGLENRREFSFLEVNDGQGTHLWIDFNDNGVKELNEFEVAGANNTFQANYIKVFTPTNDFIRVFSNQFNQVLFLKPNAFLSGEKGVRKFVGRFSNKAAYRAERETQNEEDIYNPFNNDVEDSSLVSINNSFANTLYFNRLSPKFGIDYFYLNNTGKSLLTNGFESRKIIQRELRSRYNISRIYSLESRFTLSDKENRSEFFDSRNFNIETREVEPKFIYQPSVKFRVTILGIYAEKVNTIGTERSYNRTASAELRFNEAGKGTFSLSASYIDILFNAPQNTSLAFEMLDGLAAGGNITWNVLWQRNLGNNLQLNLNYGGRKSEDLRVIHTGGMQVRAFF